MTEKEFYIENIVHFAKAYYSFSQRNGLCPMNNLTIRLDREAHADVLCLSGYLRDCSREEEERLLAAPPEGWNIETRGQEYRLSLLFKPSLLRLQEDFALLYKDLKNSISKIKVVLLPSYIQLYWKVDE